MPSLAHQARHLGIPTEPARLQALINVWQHMADELQQATAGLDDHAVGVALRAQLRVAEATVQRLTDIRDRRARAQRAQADYADAAAREAALTRILAPLGLMDAPELHVARTDRLTAQATFESLVGERAAS